MRVLTKDEILATELETKVIDVPEWYGSVRVKVMNGVERDAFDKWLSSKPAENVMDGMKVRVCALCIVDEDGNRMFTDDDIQELQKKSGAALSRIFTIAQEMNYLLAGSIEEASGESEPEQNGDSSSG